ncbi:MAG: PD40 domain-containing protein [Flavobacteriales bacterium]|nr:PD40 domain-containing protein [Flavobacteriales bacterium]
MMKRFLLLLILSLLTVSVSFAQGGSDADQEMIEGDEGLADDYFFNENYKAALNQYLVLLQEEPEDLKYNYNTGLCYLNSDFEKIKSIPYFEKVIFYDEEASTVYFLMGQAYQNDFQFDRAIDMFNKFLEFHDLGSEFTLDDAEQQIEYCENAYELMKFPKDCTFENLGGHINSEYPDYFPFVTIDERFIAYTSKRDDGSALEPDGTFASNIYYSNVVSGEYTDGVPMPGATNDPRESEVIVGMSGDGANMLLMKGFEGISGDIFQGDFSDDRLSNIRPLDDKVNSKFREIAASFSTDGNSIYFVSDRPDGYGGTDIWIIKKVPTGKWGVPFNAGPDVNTELDEDFPNLSPDGEFLYFSSKGHFSMGGYDIFKSKWNLDSNRFMNPRNLGYPINSVDDDMNYRVSRTGRYGYMSALREDGYGDYDIYRITINEVESEFSVVRGLITSAEEGFDVNSAEITVSDLLTGDLYGIYTPNPKTMRYVIILPPGEFEVFVDSPGFEPVSFEVKILGKSSFQPEIDKNLELVLK